jgi:hypothetical protein
MIDEQKDDKHSVSQHSGNTLVVCSTGSYLDFLQTKQKTHILSGFDVDEKKLNNNMFDFQNLL